MAGEPSISKGDIFHLLQNARRRAVLRYLLEHDDRTTFIMRDIAEKVAAWEQDTTVEGLSSDERQRVYIALYQSHLPKLDDYGVISYDQERGIIEPTSLLTMSDPYLGDGLHNAEEHLLLHTAVDDDEPDQSGLTQAITDLWSK